MPQIPITKKATLLYDCQTLDLVIPCVCDGETLCGIVQEAIKEPVGCVEAHMVDGVVEYSCKVWYADEHFEAIGDVFLQIPFEMRMVEFVIVHKQQHNTVKCLRCDIANHLFDMGIEEVFDQNGTLLLLNEVQFIENHQILYTSLG